MINLKTLGGIVLTNDLLNLYIKKSNNLLQPVRVMIFLNTTTVSLRKLILHQEQKNRFEAYVFCKKGVLRKFPNFTGKHLWILRDVLEHLFCVTCDYSILHKIGVLKNLAKFMGMAASSISGNMLCLAGCKFIDVLQNWHKSGFKVSSISTEMQFLTDLALLST